MAELDPEKVGRSGVDPVTGSPLSQEVRTALLKKSTIDASVFQNIENKRAQSDIQNAELSRGQNEALLGFNSTLQAIRTDIVKLGTGLSGIALLLQQDAAEDQNKVRADQEKERRLAERQIRIGKENEIEQKIQNAIAEPVQKLVPQVNDIFGKIGAALGILFGGWLTNQTVQAIKASEEGNTKLFNDIRFNILKNIGIAVGGLVAIRTGFSLIKRTIGGIASGLTKLLIAKPLALASTLLSRAGGGPKPGGKPSGGKNFFGLGSLVNLAFGGIDFLQRKGDGQTNLQAGAGASASIATSAVGTKIGSKFPGILKFPATIALGVAGYMLGGKGSDILTGVNNPTESLKPTPSPAPAEPKTPMMGEQKPSTPAPSPDMEKKFEQAWQYRNNPIERGRIEGAWSKMSPEQQQQAKTWAQTKGYDWNEMKLKDSANINQPSKTEEAKITSAQVTIPPKEPQQVGQLPEPKPSLTMIKTSSAQQQQPNPPLTNGALTDVPLINSANPDNFYVLYSQLNYNVVM
jgi:hypothetical protein